MKDICPNCGAAITDEKCPYCGSMFLDFACVDMDKPCYIKFKYQDRILRAKCQFTGLTYNVSCNDVYAYADTSAYYVSRSPDSEITLTFLVLPDDGVLSRIVNTKEVSKDARPW